MVAIFLQIEKELIERNRTQTYDIGRVSRQSSIEVFERHYDKVALTPPLMMDFSGEKNYIGNPFGIKNKTQLEESLKVQLPVYEPKNKSIGEQEFDLFKGGVKDYYDHSKHQLLEFYPLGGELRCMTWLV